MKWLPVEQWRAATPPVQLPRSGALLHIVVRQFDVERNIRYQPRDGKTWCNIFVSDVTAALGAPIPHWVTTAGRPTDHTDKANGARELTANKTQDWLLELGPKFGWREIKHGEAVERANAGFPTVAVWKNPQSNGHIAILVPGGIAQAGGLDKQGKPRNFNLGSLERGFGTPGKEILFFTHD